MKTSSEVPVGYDGTPSDPNKDAGSKTGVVGNVGTEISAVSFGGGVNSTALLIGLVQRRYRPDFIMFADTGGEFEETYQHVKQFSQWLTSRDFPPIITVHRNYERHATLEAECHNLKTLPSKAFGFSGCSVKWKRQPMDRFLSERLPVQWEWAAGRQVVRMIGIDYDEQHRGQIPDTQQYK